MKYLVVCDHVKKSIESSDPHDAIMKLPCKKCVGYNLGRGKAVQKGVLVYAWDGPDVEARRLPTPREPKE